MSEVKAVGALKHQGILDSVGQLETAVSKAENLLDRIVGEDRSSEQETETTKLSTLAYMLDNTADSVDRQTSKLHDVVSGMEDALF